MVKKEINANGDDSNVQTTNINLEEEVDGFSNHSNIELDSDKQRLTSSDNPFAQTYTVATAISQIGYGRTQFEMLFLCGVCWAADSMEMMLLGFLLPAVGEEWKLDSFWNATVGAVVFSGMLIGAPLWGVLSDKYGRRLGFIASATLTFVFGLASSFSTNLPLLLITRGLVGVGIGGAPVAFSLFTEFLPLEQRGKNLIMIEAFWSAGAVFEAGLAWLVLPRLGWRWLLGISSIPSLILLFLIFKLPESPRYLLKKGNKEKAVQVLQRVAKANKKQLPEGELYVPESELTSESPVLVFQLFKSKLRKQTLLLWIIWFANAFAYYGLVIMTPDYFKTRGGDSKSSVYVSVFITSAAEFPGLISSALLVDKLGRKRTQSLCFFLCSAFTLLLIINGPFALSTFFAVVARLSIAASFACIYLYTPEAYPTEVRTTALGMASSFSRIGALLCSYVIEFFQKAGDWASLTIFGVSCLIAAVTTLFLPVETSKRELK